MKIAWMMIFFLLFSLPVTAAEKTSPIQNRGATNVSDLQPLLDSFETRGERHIENVLRGLRVISLTEEVQSEKWENMKGLLSEFQSSVKAAAVWFARSDGSYYTVETGLTVQNLKDRQYFPRLIAGEEIAGDLVIGKVTGKRSAIVAVPVKKNGKTIGALGASLAVDDMSRMLDEEMGLPEDIIFYALDQKGQTSLHRISALLFAYPSDMGSQSLAKTVGEMLAKPEGTVTYDFYGERTVVFKKAPLTGWVYAIGIVTGKRSQDGTELPPVLSEMEKAVTAELNKMDKDLAKLAGRLSDKDLKTAEKRKMLADLCGSHPYAADCALVDKNGRMVMVEPEKYAGFEGTDISSQEQVIRLWKTKKPVMSNVIRAVEGFDAADLEHPIFSSGGELEGSVSILFRPDALFSHPLTPLLRGMPVETFAMQTDGRILYDEDKEEVGRMLFDDPLYKPFPQLIAIGTMAGKEKKGAGSYDFKQRGSEKLAKKDAYWTTVGLHGTEWRLVVMHIRTGHAASGEDTAKPGTTLNDALRSLAGNADMKKAMSGGDAARIQDVFKNFYSAHAGLYSIQWLDAGGINRYGYPEENSLVNLDMKSAKTPSAKPLLDTLSLKRESSFESLLAEGRTGAFFMVPVYEGGDYLGMIYTIRIKE